MKSKLDLFGGILSILGVIIAVLAWFIDLSGTLKYQPIIIGVVLLVLAAFLVGLYSSRIAKRIRKISSTRRVFISYRSEDKAIAEEIADALRNSGAKVWDASERVLPGQDWKAAIIDALSSTDTVVTVLSRKPSNWVSYELKLALNQQIPIIPVLTSKFDLPSDLERLSYIDLSQGKEEGINKVVEAST